MTKPANQNGHPVGRVSTRHIRPSGIVCAGTNTHGGLKPALRVLICDLWRYASPRIDHELRSGNGAAWAIAA